MDDANSVIKFWRDAGPKLLFSKNDEFDRDMERQFGALHKRAAAGELADWRNQPDSALALILLLDQFSRNLFRNDPGAFLQDALALDIAKFSLDQEYDTKVEPSIGLFFYMPFMHSESLADQQHCVRLFHATGLEENLKFAILHRDIIARFGRFPHRNKVLNRSTSASEKLFLDAGGFSG